MCSDLNCDLMGLELTSSLVTLSEINKLNLIIIGKNVSKLSLCFYFSLTTKFLKYTLYCLQCKYKWYCVCTTILAIKFKVDCASVWIFLHFFCVKRVGIAIKLMVSCHQLTEKVYVIQTNEHLWDLVAFTWKKQCGPEPIISALEMVFCFKKTSWLSVRKSCYNDGSVGP